MEDIHPNIRTYLIKHHGLPADASPETARAKALTLCSAGELTIDKLRELRTGTVDKSAGAPSMEDLIGAAGGDGANEINARVKCAGESYSITKGMAKHATFGRPVCDEFGRTCQTTSELEFAKAGAFYKWIASRSGIQVAMTDHDRGMVNEMFAKDTWCGKIDNEFKTGIEGTKVKALLSDSTSGGVEINPEWFDDMLVTFPLLHSEILPLVTMRPVPRGAAVEAASVGNPTVQWNVASGTEISLFNTASLVAAIDSTIFPVASAVEVGRDLLNDTPANVGQVLVENIGQRMLQELDRVIVLGDGTNEPTGITVQSGISSVNSANDTSGPVVNADALTLFFGTNKVYRSTPMRPAYISNDTTYSRFRSSKVNASNDDRLVMGMDVGSYSVYGWPYKIQNSLGNSTAVFGALAKYHLYRRQGHNVRYVTEDAQLAKQDKVLIIVRGRYGGKVVDTSAFVKMTDLKS